MHKSFFVLYNLNFPLFNGFCYFFNACQTVKHCFPKLVYVHVVVLMKTGNCTCKNHYLSGALEMYSLFLELCTCTVIYIFSYIFPLHV